MDTLPNRSIAAQLRCPHGAAALAAGKKMNVENVHINQTAIDALEPGPGDRILEIGMGNGCFVKDLFLLNDNIQYTGCDYSETMVEAAKSRNKQLVKNGHVQFVEADVQQLPFGNALFTKIFSVDGIYFWDSPAKALAEIRRVMVPGGKLLIAIRPKKTMELYAYTQYGFTLYTKTALLALLNSHQFRVTEIMEKQEPLRSISGKIIQPETLMLTCFSL